MRSETDEPLRLRLQRWNAVPHYLSPPSVDWSPRANRRVGWRAPAAPLRNPHARDLGAAAPGRIATPSAALASPPDTVRIAFIRVDFKTDRSGGQTTGNGRFDLSGPDTTIAPIDRPPHNRTFYLSHLEALRRYYDAESYGRVVIEGDVWPHAENEAYTVSDMADFGPWRLSQDIYSPLLHMWRTMMFAADSQSIERGDRIPWDRYDRFMIIHAGSDFQSDIRQDSPLDIPSVTLGASDTNVVIFPDSLNRPIDRVTIVPETANQDGFYAALNGVIAHENGHNIFGFSDLYDVESFLSVVGFWSLMDSGNNVGSPVQLANGDEIFVYGLLPPSLDPFNRFFTGDALAFRDVAWGDTMTVMDSERNPDMRRVFLSSDEYLVLENRAISPAEFIELDQDSVTRVVLGPKTPDRFEYDALLPGPGMLVWHIDASVIPFETAFRINPDYGYNSNFARPGISVIEADGLGDLGDPGSRYYSGSPRDPFYLSNNAVLADATIPDLRPHIGTWPHTQLNVLDDPGPQMRFTAARAWQLPGWPVAGDFPPGGPELLAVDADGDRGLDVCWAGGAEGSPDSAAIFAVRPNGRGINDTTAVIARLNRRPRPPLAALPIGEPGGPGQPAQGPSYFAVSTYSDCPDTSVCGQVILLDHFGNPLPGWPPALPSRVTTPPVIAGGYPTATVYVGCANQCVYALGLDGAVRAVSPVLGFGPFGRLAVDTRPPGINGTLVAVPGGSTSAAVLLDDGSGTLRLQPGWPRLLESAPVSGARPQTLQSSAAAVPSPAECLWMDFDGQGAPATGTPTCPAGRSLVVHRANRLWAFCADGSALPGWGRVLADTLVTGLGAGDPDGDGYAEVLTQSRDSGLGFWNQSGYPSPGWPKRPTREHFTTDSPPLAVDVDGDGRTEAVAMNASGILAALDAQGRTPAGWPLATGAGAGGSLVAADLNRDGFLEIVAPDRAVPDSLRYGANGRFGTLYAYSLPVSGGMPTATSWTMLGGDPGRTATLPSDRSPAAGAAHSGPFVAGSLKAYPNPARRQPVSFAYQLTEPADVEFSIVDSSGHEVASFLRAGKRADNLEVWDPGRAPAGLYLARLRFRGGSSEHSEVITVGVLK